MVTKNNEKNVFVKFSALVKKAAPVRLYWMKGWKNYKGKKGLAKKVSFFEKKGKQKK